MHDAGSSTGIPIEILFGIIGALVSFIYADLKREVRILRRESNDRTVKISKLSIILGMVCHKLGVPFGHILDDKDDEDDNHRHGI
jgi:hypothetical protein